MSDAPESKYKLVILLVVVGVVSALVAVIAQRAITGESGASVAGGVAGSMCALVVIRHKRRTAAS